MPIALVYEGPLALVERLMPYVYSADLLEV
jgi:hypothetical protein